MCLYACVCPSSVQKISPDYNTLYCGSIFLLLCSILLFISQSDLICIDALKFVV